MLNLNVTDVMCQRPWLWEQQDPLAAAKTALDKTAWSVHSSEANITADGPGADQIHAASWPSCVTLEEVETKPEQRTRKQKLLIQSMKEVESNPSFTDTSVVSVTSVGLLQAFCRAGERRIRLLWSLWRRFLSPICYLSYSAFLIHSSSDQ